MGSRYGAMVPEVVCDDFIQWENKHGEKQAIPRDVVISDASWQLWGKDRMKKLHKELVRFHGSAQEDSIEVIRGKWWARLAMPGYMDSTDWMGPFDSVEGAEQELDAMYADDDYEEGEDRWT